MPPSIVSDLEWQEKEETLQSFCDALVQGVQRIVPEINNDEEALEHLSMHYMGWGIDILLLKRAFLIIQNDSKSRNRLQELVTTHAAKLINTRNTYQLSAFLHAVNMSDAYIYSLINNEGLNVQAPEDVEQGVAIINHGTAEQIDTVLAQHPRYLRYSNGRNNLFSIGKFRDAISDLIDFMKAYARRNNISTLGVFTDLGFLPQTVQEICKRQYDLVIGILGAGATIPLALDVLDENVAFMEWHRHWKIQPRWRMLRTKADVRHGMKILLCENDTVSGQTLSKVLAVLDKISPAKVDVCFTGLELEKSKSRAIRLSAFDDVFTPEDLPREHMYSTLIGFNALLRDRLADTPQS